MRKLTRWVAVASVLAMLAVMGAAAQARQVTLEFWTISLQPYFNDYINGLISRYEAQHPGVKIRWVDVQIQAIEQKLLAAIAGGVAPDVVNLNTGMVVRLAEQGALVNLDEKVPKNEKALYFEGLWESGRYKGATYGVPWYVVPDVMAYNTDLFRRAGLDPAKPPATEDEIIADAKRIKDTIKVYGFMPNVDGVRMLQRFQEAGLPVLSPDGKKAVFNSPQHVAYLAKYVDLFKQDYFPEDTIRRGYLGATERYTAGQLGMLITGPQFLLRVKKDNPDVYAKTDVAPYPLGAGKVFALPVMRLSVPKMSRNVDEAVRFALFVTNDENQLAFSKLVTIFPSTKQAAADPFFRAGGDSPEDKARRISAQELEYAKDLEVVVPKQGELNKIFQDAIESAFFGQRTPKEALDWAVQEWNRRL